MASEEMKSDEAEMRDEGEAVEEEVDFEEVVDGWRESVVSKGRAIRVTIERQLDQAIERVEVAPTDDVNLELWDDQWFATGPTAPLEILEQAETSITYRTDDDQTITEEAVDWPTDRWGRPYRPWDLEQNPRIEHVLHWSDGETHVGVIKAPQEAEDYAEAHPEEIEVIRYELAAWSGEGHEGSLQRAEQESWGWRGVDITLIVTAPGFVIPEQQPDHG